MRNVKFVILILVISFVGCSDSPTGTTGGGNGGRNGNGGGEEEESFEPIEEKIPNGAQEPVFFLDGWEEKNIQAPPYTDHSKPAGELDSRIQINVNNIITKVPNTIYGNNTNPYIGQMVDQPVLLEHLRNLKPHLIRFPGGNISNVYFWDREPGNPPETAPPANELLTVDGTNRENEGYWYGNNDASWTLSLDNYYQMLQETGNNGVISINYSYARYGEGSTPVQTAAGYAADWVRYDDGRTKYWEIGNENYGEWQAGYRIDTGKNKNDQPEFISGELYGAHAEVFIDSMKKAAQEIGSDIKIGTQLIEREVTESYETDIVRHWNEQYFTAAGDIADYYVVHNYYTPFQEDSEPSVILNSAHNVTSNMMQWMNVIMNRNSVQMKPIALTEWNIFSTGSQQMVSDISGMHAAMTLGELIKYEYGMAARWDIANGWSGGNDHGMFNLGDAPGGVPKWNPRPDFYHMYYFHRMFGNRMVWSGTQGDKALVSYASTFSSGQVGLVIANKSSSSKLFDVEFKNFAPGDRYYWYVLEGGNEDPFSRKVLVNGKGPDGAAGGPDNYESLEAYSAVVNGEGGIKLDAPAHSVLYILIENE